MLKDITSRCEYLDFVDLIEYRRSACRLSVRTDDLGPTIDAVHEEGFEFGIMPTPYQVSNIYGGKCARFRHDDTHEIYVARDLFVVRDVMAAEHSDGHNYLGGAYAYPICCTEAFYDTMWKGRNCHNEYPHLGTAMFKSTKGGRYNICMTPEMDNRVISFFPCTFECRYALESARRRATHMLLLHQWEIQPTVFNGRIFDVA